MTECAYISVVTFGHQDATGLARVPKSLLKELEGTDLIACGVRSYKEMSKSEYETYLAFETHPDVTESIVKKLHKRVMEKNPAYAHGIWVDSNDGERHRKTRLWGVLRYLEKKCPEVLLHINGLYDHKGNFYVIWEIIPTDEFVEKVNSGWENTGEVCCSGCHQTVIGNNTYMVVHTGCAHCNCPKVSINDDSSWFQTQGIGL